MGEPDHRSHIDDSLWGLSVDMGEQRVRVFFDRGDSQLLAAVVGAEVHGDEVRRVRVGRKAFVQELGGGGARGWQPVWGGLSQGWNWQLAAYVETQSQHGNRLPKLHLVLVHHEDVELWVELRREGSTRSVVLGYWY